MNTHSVFVFYSNSIMTQQNDTVYDLIKGFTHLSTAPTSSDSLNNLITTRKNITGTFQLDDSFPIRICRLFILTLTEDNNMIGLEAKERSIVANLLVFMSCLKAANHLFYSCRDVLRENILFRIFPLGYMCQKE